MIVKINQQRSNKNGQICISFIFFFFLCHSLYSLLLFLALIFSGSATLQHWQQLAQPNLGGILDARPGVVPKGFRPLELDLEEVYHYSDYEEDDPGEQYFQNLPTTTSTANPVPVHAPSASPSPCLSTGQASSDFSGVVTVVK